ncbi:MAG: Trm112 family protein [Anaerolineae bacterium]|nr:Trm112 family protein [Anaerolineae bacterium]
MADEASQASESPPIDAELLEILRCPVAVHYEGDDPGRLELVHNCWLVSHESGYKYPIRDGIPIMLVEVGEKYKDVAVEDLPVPPPADD